MLWARGRLPSNGFVRDQLGDDRLPRKTLTPDLKLPVEPAAQASDAPHRGDARRQIFEIRPCPKDFHAIIAPTPAATPAPIPLKNPFQKSARAIVSSISNRPIPIGTSVRLAGCQTAQLQPPATDRTLVLPRKACNPCLPPQ